MFMVLPICTGPEPLTLSFQVLRTDYAFARISRDPKLKYALRALPGVVPLPDALVGV